MRVRVKNALLGLHKLGFVQPSYFYTSWFPHSVAYPHCRSVRSAVAVSVLCTHHGPNVRI